MCDIKQDMNFVSLGVKFHIKRMNIRMFNHYMRNDEALDYFKMEMI